MRRRSSATEERGLVLAFVAILGVVILGLCGLAIGLGFISASQHHLRLVADAAAYAALETYSRQESSVSHTARMAAALTRANYIISQNQVVGIGSPAEVTHSSQGTLDGVSFGQYVVENPEGEGAAELCPENRVPCMVLPSSGDPAPLVNAVSVLVKSRADSPLLAPFAAFFTSEAFELQARGVAAVTTKCGAFVIDISRSSAFDTHFSNVPPGSLVAGNMAAGEPWRRFNIPGVYPALAAYRLAALKRADGSWKNCQTPADYTLPGSIEFTFWCNMGRSIGGTWVTQRPANEYYSNGIHYQSDYRVNDPVTVGLDGGANQFEIVVDRYADTGNISGYVGPRPLIDFLLAFYKAVEVTKSQTTGGDRFLLIGATGNIRVQYPPEGTTSNLDYILQVLNANNRGIFTNAHGPGQWAVPPVDGDDFVTLGMLPIFSTPGSDILGDNSTNLVLAIDRAADELRTSCPASSRRFIVVASDWVPNCMVQNGVTTCASADPFTELYLPAESTLLSSVQQKLVDNRIALTGMLAGSAVRPHFVNRLKPGCTNQSDPDCFVSLAESGLYGFNASFNPGATNFFDPVSVVPGSSKTGLELDREAFEQMGNTGVVFGRAMPLMAQVASATGGIVCPLMDKDPNDSRYFDHDSDDAAAGTTCGACPASNPECTPCQLQTTYRTVNGIQTVNPEYLSRSLSAAKCGFDVVGRQPFNLVEPVAVFQSGGSCVVGCE